MSSRTNIVDFPPTGKIAELESPHQDFDNPSLHLKPADPSSKNGISLALGGGAARGWAHIGVLRAIDEANIPVSMIAGTSIGALVGGCYLAGKLDELEEFARSITRRNILRYMDFAFRASGLINGRRLADRMDCEIGELNIEDLNRRFIAIAADIRTGSEIWLEHGSLVQAIRASYALPGVFEPVQHFGKLLVDGAILNPVPVSACRAYEQKVVLAVNLNTEVFGRSAIVRSTSINHKADGPLTGTEQDQTSWLSFARKSGDKEKEESSRLGLTGVMIEAFNIIQDKISRSRLAGDPPDFTIRPKLAEIGLSDFHKADAAIELGYEVARIKLAALEESGLREALAGHSS
ncbi:MAG: patatin-like phospholipase family protein [Pseudomonadota bacterium]